MGKQVELTVTARDLSTLEAAVKAGADAVEIVGEDFGFLAAASHRFTIGEIRQAASLSHAGGARLFVAANLIAHNRDIEKLRVYLKRLAESGVDGIVVADPGVLLTAQESVPGLEIHVNMEMGITNRDSARFWIQAGARRIVLARELNFRNIKEICQNVAGEVESQVHGAMNIFYTGRQILTNYHRYRGVDFEPGEEITSYALKEEKRPEEYYPVYEDERGTYVMSSADLCLVGRIPELVNTGLTAFRIETRPHGREYAEAIVSVYREAVDAYGQDPESYRFRSEWLERIQKVSNRPLTEGFYVREAAK